MTSIPRQATPESPRSSPTSDDDFTVLAVHTAVPNADANGDELQAASLDADLARFEDEIAESGALPRAETEAAGTEEGSLKVDDDLNDVQLAVEDDAREERLQEDLHGRVARLRKRLYETTQAVGGLDETPEGTGKGAEGREAEGKRIRKAARRMSWRERVLRNANSDDGELDQDDGIRRILHP